MTPIEPGVQLKIGIDLDNTIIDYGDLFYQVAVAQGLLPATGRAMGKTELRDRLRSQPDGENQWRLVQSIVYSQQLDQARLFPGVSEFLQQCRQSGAVVHIISHKTEWPNSSQVPQLNLRHAALDWLAEQGLVEPAPGFFLARSQVSFHATRPAKLAAIRSQQCQTFIDDLPQILADEHFPSTTQPILFDPSGQQRATGQLSATGMICCSTWEEVRRAVFEPE